MIGADTEGPRERGTKRTRSARLQTEPAKSRLVELVTDGLSIADGLRRVQYARKTYEAWRRNDKDFAARIDQARQLRAPRKVERGERLGFAEWRWKYLRTKTYWHQLQWIDMLEGRDPRELHPSQTYTKGKRSRLIVNVPPFHAKSATITMDYVTYRLCIDPGFRVLVISAGAELAKDFLYGIKQRLTDPEYMDLQLAYAPDGGWESTAEAWNETRIVFGTRVRAQSNKQFHEKDANVLALGMRSKVYGRRADLIILDDAVDTTNVAEHAKQLKWLRSMVESRLEAGGKLLVVGTRVATIDLYSELMNPENYGNGRVPWTYFASPAILEYGSTPDRHVTLWPYAQVPWVDPEDAALDECLCGDPHCSEGYLVDGERVFARWDGLHLERGPKDSNSATDWALIYQQESVPEDATFPEWKVNKAINGLRLCGRLEPDRVGHPIGGMHDKWILAGLDPSIKGFAGIVVEAIDRSTNKRFVLAAVNMKAPTSEALKDRMKDLTRLYGVNEWRVEKTGLLQFFTQDRALRQWFQTRGVKFTEHTTGTNKWDPAFGVSSMASLFGEYDKAWNDQRAEWREITPPLIEFPRANQEGMKALIHQLLIWTPELDPAKIPCDLVMALWFAEIGAREYLGVGRSKSNVVPLIGSRFAGPRAMQRRTTVDLRDLRGIN